MASRIKLIDPKPVSELQSNLNGMVVIDRDETTPTGLADRLAGFDFGTFLGFTAPQDLISAIIYFPIDLQDDRFANDIGRMLCHGSPVGNGNIGYVASRDLNYEVYSAGFHIAEYELTYTGKYTDYEPYIKTDVWLPFYGLVNVPRTRLVGKWMQIFLYIDYNTGDAQYIIASSSGSIKSQIPSYPFLYGSTFDVFEIISSYSFTLGYKLPIGRTGYNEYLRTIASGLVQTVASVTAASLATPASLVPISTTASTSAVSKHRNPSTGRMVTTSKYNIEKTESRESDIGMYRTGKMAQSVAGSVNSIMNIHTSGGVSNPNNQVLMCYGSKSVYVFNTIANLVEYTDDFDHLYGRPLGDTRVLRNMHGFVDISSVRLEGSLFGTATSEELDEIEAILMTGVILP